MAKKVAVLGGGNGAHAAAADLTLRGYEVHMYEDARFAPNMQKVFDTKTIELKGACGSGEVHVAMVTTDLQEAIADVKLILGGSSLFCAQQLCTKAGRGDKTGTDLFWFSREPLEV